MRYLKIHTLENGWCDKDEMLLHAAFQLLVDFVEKEQPGEIVDWDADESHKKSWKEIQSLYQWWKDERPARKSPLDDAKIKHPPMEFEKIPNSDLSRMVEYDKEKYATYDRALAESVQLEQQWEEQDQRNLHRLIDIRQFLWT